MTNTLVCSASIINDIKLDIITSLQHFWYSKIERMALETILLFRVIVCLIGGGEARDDKGKRFGSSKLVIIIV